MSDESLLQVARIAAGEFVMGAEDGEEESVRLTGVRRRFCIGIYRSPTAVLAVIRETALRSAIRARP